MSCAVGSTWPSGGRRSTIEPDAPDDPVGEIGLAAGDQLGRQRTVQHAWAVRIEVFAQIGAGRVRAGPQEMRRYPLHFRERWRRPSRESATFRCAGRDRRRGNGAGRRGPTIGRREYGGHQAPRPASRPAAAVRGAGARTATGDPAADRGALAAVAVRAPDARRHRRHRHDVRRARGAGAYTYVVGGIFGLSTLGMLITNWGGSSGPRKAELHGRPPRLPALPVRRPPPRPDHDHRPARGAQPPPSGAAGAVGRGDEPPGVGAPGDRRRLRRGTGRARPAVAGHPAGGAR